MEELEVMKEEHIILNGDNIVMTEIESDHIVKTLLFKKENIWDMVDIIGWNKYIVYCSDHELSSKFDNLIQDINTLIFYSETNNITIAETYNRVFELNLRIHKFFTGTDIDINSNYELFHEYEMQTLKRVCNLFNCV